MTQNLSILIITYNRPEDTLELLRDLSTQHQFVDCVGEVLLLNNNSTVDYSIIENFISSHSKLPIIYFNHPENLGVARGRNYLIKEAKFPYLLVLDDDVVFAEKDAILRISKLFQKERYIENNTAALTLNIFYYDTKERQKSAMPHKQYERYKDKEWFLTSYFVGAAHLMKKELFDKTGDYPIDFFYGMEEYDLSYRIINQGYTIAYDNEVLVYHKESPTGRVPAKEKLAMMWYNKCVVARKYLPKKYFYSTAFFWTFEYLRKTKFDVIGAFKNLRKIARIPKNIPQQTIGDKAIDYLRQVEARLWY